MPFEVQPRLKGTLLELRPLRAADFDELFAVASDPLIWEQHPARDRHEETVFRAFFKEAMESGGALVAIDAADGKIIGSSRFHGYDEAKSEVEIGWTFLARSHWGGQYNGEMKELMLRHAFQFVDHVIFVIGPENRRSRRAVEKIGGVLRGQRIEKDGRETVVYEIGADTMALGAAESDDDETTRITRSEVAAVARRFADLSRVAERQSVRGIVGGLFLGLVFISLSTALRLPGWTLAASFFGGWVVALASSYLIWRRHRPELAKATFECPECKTRLLSPDISRRGIERAELMVATGNCPECGAPLVGAAP